MEHRHSPGFVVVVGLVSLCLVACNPAEKPRPTQNPESDIVQYTGPASDVTTVHRHESGALYSSSAEVMNAIKVGMATQEVSEILKADFSPSQGIMFWFYTRDTYMRVEFENGQVAELRRGHNGVCLRLRE